MNTHVEKPKLSLLEKARLEINHVKETMTSPKAYSGYAVVGVLGTIALTAFATIKVYDTYHKKMKEKNKEGTKFAELDKDERKEVAVAVVKESAPAVAGAVVSAAGTICSITKGTKKANEIIDDYRKIANFEARQIDYYKEKTLGKIPTLAAAAVAKDMCKNLSDAQNACPEDDEFDEYGDKRVWVFEPISKTHMKMSRGEFYRASRYLEILYATYGWASVNDWMTLLGIKPMKCPGYYGWCCEEGYDMGLYCLNADLSDTINETGEYIIWYDWEPAANNPDYDDYSSLNSYDSPFYGAYFPQLPSQYREEI